MKYQEEAGLLGLQADSEILALQNALQESDREAGELTAERDELQREHDALKGEYAAHLAADQAAKFVLGVTKPEEWNTGLTRTPTSVIKSDTTIQGSGRTFERVQFDGYIDIAGATDTTFVDCLFRGPRKPTTQRHLIKAWDARNKNTVFKNCEFAPQSDSHLIDSCMLGHNFTLDRCRVRGGVDGIGIHHPTLDAPQNVNILGSYIGGGLSYWCPYPGQSDNRTHNDCIQVHGHLNGVRIIGSRIEGIIDPRAGNGAEPVVKDASGKDASGYRYYPEYFAMSCIMFSPIKGKIQNVVIDKNWFNGGEVMLNFAGWTSAAPGAIRVTYNRVGQYRLKRTQMPDGCFIIAKSSLPIELVGNVEEGTGKSYNIRLNG